MFFHAKLFPIIRTRYRLHKITAIEDPRVVMYKGVKLMSFDAEFKTNVSIPDYVGLGKGVSLGMGMVVRRYEKKNEDNNE